MVNPALYLHVFLVGISVRLAGGKSHYGRVEIQYDGHWGTVCDYAWSRYDARALCRQLGFVEGIAYARSRYGRGQGPVYLDDMRCRADDQSIFWCPNRGWNNSARYCMDHDNDAGVYCFPRGETPSLLIQTTYRGKHCVKFKPISQ